MSVDAGKPLDGTSIEVDEPTCQRAGALAAYGCGDEEICDTLVITPEQLIAAKQSLAYGEQYALKVQERMAQQIDISDGWNSVEQNAVAKVLSALKHTENPTYALAAARVANQAKRHVGGRTARTIDPGKVSQIVHITLNAGFVKRSQSIGNTIEGTQRPVVEMKRVDMPTPRQVTDLLSPVRPLLEKMKEHRVEDQMEAMNFGEIMGAKHD